MRKFKLTNPNFKGHVMLSYDIDGLLASFRNESEMTKSQLIYFFNNYPFRVDDIGTLSEKSATVFEEIPADLSFDAFWTLLEPRNKINKKRCVIIWEGITDAQRMMAISQYPHYITYCKSSGRWVADPENYLKKELYNTNWRAKI